MFKDSGFRGEAKRLEDIDLPRIGADIGVGEDVIHMLLEVESLGDGFDSKNRPKMLFEPHVFYRLLSGKERDAAVKMGIAYPHWKRQYPTDSYPRLHEAIKVNETAALKSASWGGSQVLGISYKKAGYASVQDMVQAFMDDEENHVKALITFVKNSGLTEELKKIDAKLRNNITITPSDTRHIAWTYNGDRYAESNYHVRLANAANKWAQIKDTPFDIQTFKLIAEAETEVADFKNLEVPTMKDEAKGVTATTKSPDTATGAIPPAEAIEIKASRPSLKSTAVAVGTFFMGILSYFGIEPKRLGDAGWNLVQTNALLLAQIVAGFGLIVLAVWAWNKSMDRAQQRTLKVMDAAKDKNENNIRLV